MDEPAAVRSLRLVPADRRAAAVLGLLVILVVALVVVSSASGSARPRVLVIGNGSVAGAETEIARRFRQEGEPADVRVVPPTECADLTSRVAGYERVIVSFDDWGGCGPWPSQVIMLVEQPGGATVGTDAARGVTVRPVNPLFGAEPRVACRWWDTPGAGEQVPGLGQCESDGKVTVLDGGPDFATLTPAGDERFARMIVETAA